MFRASWIWLVGAGHRRCTGSACAVVGQGTVASCEFWICGPPDPVIIDRTGYQLVLSNLLSNAIKYTERGDVQVTLDHGDSGPSLHVADTGIGIPESDLSKLFGEFFRAENARKSNIQGTGVGLAAIKELVERFAGSMEVDSREGAGSTFTVRWPTAG